MLFGKAMSEKHFPVDVNVDPYALFAFDATWLLIHSLKQLCSPEMHSDSIPCLAFSNSTFCFDRQLMNATSFSDQIGMTKFLGVSGPIDYEGNGTDLIDGIHYITRNVQTSTDLSFVPTLKYSEPGDKKSRFSASIFENALQLIIRKPAADQLDFSSYLRLFSGTLWIAILATMIYTSFLIVLVERHDNATLHDRSILPIGAMSFWYSIGNIIGYGAYTSNLASDIRLSKPEYIEDMKQGKITFNRIGIRIATAANVFCAREISGRSRDENCSIDY